MPTDPLKTILDRDLSVVGAHDFIEVAGGLLQELVNFSTNAFARCDGSTTGGIDEDIAILSLFRSMIGLTDSIEVLISRCCGLPATPLVRTSFETLLSMQHILEDDTKYAQRSLSWLAFFIHQKLDLYDRLDSSTPKGADFAKALSIDSVLKGLTIPPPASLQKERATLASILKKPHMQPIEAEFQSRKKVTNWFQLFGGPPNLFELAQSQNQAAQYHLLYRTWSRAAHATDFTGFSLDQATGQPVVEPLRNPEDLKPIASFACSFMLTAIRITIAKFRPTEDLEPWYKREVQQRYHAVTRKGP